MSYVLTGYFKKSEAEALSNLASESDELGYPAVATFEDEEGADRWRVDIYFETLPNETTVAREFGAFAAHLSCLELPDDTNWVLEGLKDLKPVSVGRFFVHGSHERQAVKANHHALLIDANMAFGTGHHGTTSGCLEAISYQTNRRKYRRILDLGTGSGVLAIALAKQTHMPVLATDIDPVSVNIAKQNMRINEVANLVTCETASGFHHPIFAQKRPFDLIVANILAAPLCALARPMAHYLKPGACLILSGLLVRQKAQVVSAYREQGIYLEKVWQRDGWATLAFRRP